MTDTPRWPVPWIRAGLDLAVLGSLTRGPRHGYAIAQELAAHGFGLLKGGSLYPVLNRLEEAGSVEAAWVEGTGGPGKRQYHLTAAGRTRLQAELTQWRELADTLSEMARTDDPSTGGTR
ncbi:PadR family transcriptional regulator [Nocardioides campestrisoli]|uniref:PadR family transcriptional regulator n=1 Tax=Nocardioides campestrisoli TaxID=2736757 RepID=UPI0015E72BA4|nr:PadR family transcriptional regulator [Nocardioides campestrisoli]